jgi:hypothetical protein
MNYLQRVERCIRLFPTYGRLSFVVGDSVICNGVTDVGCGVRGFVVPDPTSVVVVGYRRAVPKTAKNCREHHHRGVVVVGKSSRHPCVHETGSNPRDTYVSLLNKEASI